MGVGPDLAGVAAVGPDQTNRGEHGPDDPGQQPAGVAVLDVGAGGGGLGCGLPGKDVDTQGGVFESGVGVWSLLLLLEGPLLVPSDTPGTRRRIDDHVRPPTRDRLFTRPSELLEEVQQGRVDVVGAFHLDPMAGLGDVDDAS